MEELHCGYRQDKEILLRDFIESNDEINIEGLKMLKENKFLKFAEYFNDYNKLARTTLKLGDSGRDVIATLKRGDANNDLYIGNWYH